MENNFFNQNKYKKGLIEFIKNISVGKIGSKQLKSEEDLRQFFAIWLNDFLKEVEYIDKEAYFLLDNEVRVRKGRIDSKFRNIIIEFKIYGLLDNPKELQNAKDQLKEKYLLDDKYKNQTMYGFLFDGKSIFTLYKNYDNKIEELNSKSGKLDLEKFNFFIITLTSKEISAFIFKEDFSILDINIEKPSLKLLRILFVFIKKSQNQRTLLLYKEWEKLFKLSESDKGKHEDIVLRRETITNLIGDEINNSDSEYKALYSLHTALSIILKLIAIKIIDNFVLNKKSITFTEIFNLELKDSKVFFGELENGNLFKNSGILNLIEGDFFSWYIKENWNEKIYNILKELIIELSLYNEPINSNRTFKFLIP
ncbi:MAG: hypothetical protein ACYDDB_06155 [bacterium]